MKTNMIKGTGWVILFSFLIIFYKISLIILTVVLIGILIRKLIQWNAVNSDGWKRWK